MNRRGCPYPLRSFPKKRGAPGRMPTQPQRNILIPGFVPPVALHATAATLANPLGTIFNRYKKAKQVEVVDLNTTDSYSNVDMVESPRSSSPLASNSSSSDGHEPPSPPDISMNASCSDSPVLSSVVEDVIQLDDEEVSFHGDSDDDSDIQIITEPASPKDEDDDDVICTDDNLPSGSKRKDFVPALEDSLVRGTMQQTRGQVAPRVWEEIKPLLHMKDVKETVIRICSYNVLCQNTIAKTIYLYNHTKRDGSVLNWDQRWPLLAQNLELIDADIFGLQEVQESHYKSDFLPLMSKKGYGALYERKDHPNVDGCALFYRRDKYEYVLSRSVRYFLAEGTNLDKPQIAQMVRLRCKTTGKQILVANTHIIFNMNRGDIKLAQIATLLAHIDQELKMNGSVPFIILGDFNIHPSSYIYKYLINSSLFLKGLPRNELAGEGKGGPVVPANMIIPHAANIGRDSMFINNKEPRSPVEKDCLTHPLHLWSATAASRHHPDLTRNGLSTYHKDTGNPDFIFYSCRRSVSKGKVRNVVEHPSLRLVRRMSLPKLDVLRDTLGPWPNRHVPSDHIPLVAEFQLRQIND